MLIDSHAHLNFSAFKDDFDEVIRRCLENDIWVINVGTKYETSKRAIEISKKYEKGVYSAVGLHPIHLETGLVKIKNDDEEVDLKTNAENFDYEKYKELAMSEKVVAIGEIGLDYYWKSKNSKKFEEFKRKQKEALINQLNLAVELNLPVIFHCRLAHNDLIKILDSEIKNLNYKIKGVIHCFVGDLEELKKYLEMGLYIGFNGIIFKKIQGVDFKKIIKNTPLDKILIETDCPYLNPIQNEKRNEPIFVKYIAEKIAQIKNISFEEVAEITTINAKKLFSLNS